MDLVIVLVLGLDVEKGGKGLVAGLVSLPSFPHQHYWVRSLALPLLAQPIKPAARRGASFPALRSSDPVSHTHTARASSNVLHRQGAGPSLLTAVGGIQGQTESSILLSGHQVWLNFAADHRVSSNMLPRQGAQPVLSCTAAAVG